MRFTYKNVFVTIAIIVVVVTIAFALTGCGVTAHTPYGDISYRQPASVGDGKTTLR